jgi:hypothetical protein
MKPLDRTALAGRVAALEQHHDPLAGVLDPGLHLQQLDLQGPLADLVLLALHPLGVGVVLAPGVDLPTVRAEQQRLVVVELAHRQPVETGQQVGGLQCGPQLVAAALGVPGRPGRPPERLHDLVG